MQIEGIIVDLEAGESEAVTINAPAGVYSFYSILPGHAVVGMTGTLVAVHDSGVATPTP